MKPVIKTDEPVMPPAPKRRGRKKKVQVDPSPVLQVAVPVQKLYTVPKSQTYENYLRYYDQIMEDRHLDHSLDQPLIFDKFLDPEGYERLLNEIKWNACSVIHSNYHQCSSPILLCKNYSYSIYLITYQQWNPRSRSLWLGPTSLLRSKIQSSCSSRPAIANLAIF